ncbi:MAG: GMC family oxidoreductase N-terminal domain-containing protein [Opitutaceae bacterium]|nr:GMC family oxidoreductase N-terminal domain-containing protein [Opitutaceae bacterium]
MRVPGALAGTPELDYAFGHVTDGLSSRNRPVLAPDPEIDMRGAMKTRGPFDYVIVGGGTAGCLLANRLSADPNNAVLLLEAGGKDDWIWIHIPVGYLYCIGNPRTDWCYRTEPDPGLNGRSILYARGRVLGGSSSINAMLYLRGQGRDYDTWAEQCGDPGWAWQSVLPIFKQSEDHWRGADEFHGATGNPDGGKAGSAGHEWRVERQRLSWEILDTFREAAAEAGIAKVEDFNRGDNAGSSKFEVNQRSGVRVSSAKAFLRPALGRPNLTVITGAQVKRLRLEGRRVLGVEFFQDNEETYAAARRETILSAGSIGSPQILQLSGIGPGALLARHGIAVAHDLPVGDNLQDHLQLRAAFKVKNVLTLNTMANSWWGKAKMALEYAIYRTGPLTMAPSQLGAFVKSDPSQATPNLEFHVQPLSLEKFGDPLHPFPAFTASVCNLRPASRGYIRIKSADPRAAPAIMLNYLSAPEDQAIAIESLRLARRVVLGTQAMKKYAPEEFLPGPAFRTDAELVTAAGNVGTTIFHPVGTCKMGRADDPSAVVDSQLRVRGIEGLRVIDASIMPNITSGNTNSPTLMIAERGAALVLGGRA